MPRDRAHSDRFPSFDGACGSCAAFGAGLLALATTLAGSASAECTLSASDAARVTQLEDAVERHVTTARFDSASVAAEEIETLWSRADVAGMPCGPAIEWRWEHDAYRTVAGLDAPDRERFARSSGELRHAIALQRGSHTDSAVVIFESIASLYSRTLGPGHPWTAQVDGRLALALHADRRPDEALPIAYRYLDGLVSAYGEEHVEVAKAEYNVARIERALGHFPDAEALLRSSLARRERLFGADGAGVVVALTALADVLKELGRYAEAAPLARRSVAIRRAEYGDDHPRVATGLNGLGTILEALGEYREAERAYREALAIREASLAAEDPGIAYVLRNLAITLQRQGRFTEAAALLARSISIAEAAWGRDDDRVARHVRSLALVYAALGDHERAEALDREVIATLRRALGDEHPEVAKTLLNLVDALVPQRRHAEAMTVLDEAIEIGRRPNASRVHLATSLMMKGVLLRRDHRLDEAEVAVEEALGILREQVDADHPLVAQTLESLGGLARARGDYRTALTFLTQATEARRARLGPEHQRVASGLLASALCHLGLGEGDAAYRDAAEAEEVARDHLALMSSATSEALALAYADTRTSGLDLMTTLAVEPVTEHGDPPTPSADIARQARVSATWDAIVRSRGLVVDAMAARQRRAFETASDRVRSLVSELADAREQLANLAFTNVDEVEEDVYRRSLAAARSRRREAEEALTREMGAVPGAVADVGLADVRAGLPADGALVAYWRYERADARPDAPREPRIGAFVLAGPDRAPRAIDLGPERAIDDAVRAWRATLVDAATRSDLAGAEDDHRRASRRLAERIWDPIRRDVADAGHVFVVPDGAVLVVNLAALVGPDGRYLVESETPLTTLGVERDLVDAPGESAGGLLLVGDPDYGEALVTVSPGGSATPADRTDAPGFAPLPGTRVEVETIAGLWDAPEDLVVLTGADATEAAFKRAAPRFGLLHVATHGFFLDAGTTRREGLRGAGEIAVASSSSRPRRAPRSPLLRSGLVLAGANARGERDGDADDGILTAEEIAGLDLARVGCVVLSACDTGLGEVRAGEGVFGLRRAFRIAGAHGVVMSLWPVDDTATEAWMRAWYRARLDDRVGMTEAVRVASRSVIRDRRARGESTHPFLWGAFVGVGRE